MQDGELWTTVWYLFDQGDRDVERERKLLLHKSQLLSSSHLSDN
jgi:tmRNA-binding protein